MIRIKEGFKGERSVVIPKMIVDFMEKDAFCSKLHITDIGFYPHAQGHYIDRRKPIDQFVFIYCVDGQGWYRCGANRYDVASGHFFVLPANNPHAYGAAADNPWTIYWMHFKGELSANFASGLQEPRRISPAQDSRMQLRTDMFEEMLRALKSGLSIENIKYAHSILYHFFGSLLFLKEYRCAGRGERGASEADVCQQAIHFMKEHLNGRVSLQQLADYAGYTPNHFATLFKKAIGHAPLSYFNLLKMQAAADLLDTTQMKINQIAGALGYDDTCYFTRLFTKIIGIAPTAYRAKPKG